MISAKEISELNKRDVHLRVDRRQNDRPVGLYAVRPLISALRLGATGARRAPLVHPSNRACDTHAGSLYPSGGGRRSAAVGAGGHFWP